MTGLRSAPVLFFLGLVVNCVSVPHTEFVRLVHETTYYDNPVLPGDHPDPGVLFVPSLAKFVAVTTSGNLADSFPIHVSTDLVHWTFVGHVFPANSTTRPRWAVSDFWAPEVHSVGNRFVVYFVGRDTSGTLCVGAASADNAVGPFVDRGEPLVRLSDGMGAIDPHYYLDPTGTPYLIYKTDGNGASPPVPSVIYATKLTSDGLTLADNTTYLLIRNDLEWEKGIVEAPWMVQHAGRFYLFYSGNGFGNVGYSVGVASSTSLTGPFTKHGDPVLCARPETDRKWEGPGHCSVVEWSPGEWYMVFHAWRKVGDPEGRLMLVERMTWDEESGWPLVGDHGHPSEHSLPVPSK